MKTVKLGAEGGACTNCSDWLARSRTFGHSKQSDRELVLDVCIDPRRITLCQTSNGSPWCLGRGGCGEVRTV